MRHTDAYTEFERAYSYPIDRTTVVDTMGDRLVESPNGPDESVAEVLERAGTETYTSPQDLFDVFIGHLGEQYIGRKYYDDRGDNTGISGPW